MKRIVKVLIPLLMMLLIPQTLNAQTTFEFDQNYIYGKSLVEEKTVQEKSKESIDENDKLVATSKDVELYLNDDSGNFKIKNNQTNYVWSAVPSNLQGSLNDTWINTLNSPFTIDYTDDNDKVKSTNMFEQNSKFVVSVKDKQITYQLNYLDEAINFEVNVGLENGKLNIFIPKSSINDQENIKLVAINILPFMGAVYEGEISGYITASYGNGALMNYEKPKNKIDESFIGYYNPDMSYLDYSIEAITLPLLGLVHGNNSNAVAVYSTSSYNDVQNVVYPSSYLTGYSTSFFRYQVRYRYEQDLSEGKKLKKYSEKINDDIAQQYDFLENEDAGYDGISKSFRNFLLSKKVLSTENEITYGTNVRALGTTEKSTLFGTKTKELTTIEEYAKIIEELENENVTANYAYATEQPKSAYFTYNLRDRAKVLGDKNQYEQLTANLTEKGKKLEHELTLYLMNSDDSWVKNKQELLQLPSGEIKSYNKIVFLTYYALENQADKIIDYAQKNGITHLNIESPVASTITDNIEKRYELTNLQNQFTSKLNEAGITVGWTYSGDIYGLSGSNKISTSYSYDLPSIFDIEVPMFSIVLSGNMQVASHALNYTTVDENILLDLIQYNVYPSFDISGGTAADFSDTELELYSIATYNYFKNKIITIDKFVSDALTPVQGQTIKSHEIIADNVIKVTYDNNISIYVNYNTEAVNIDGIKIDAKNYKVVDNEKI